MLALVFAANYVETFIETWLKSQHQWGTRLALGFTSAVQGFEGNYSFENHDLTNLLAVYGYSISYYFVFPALALVVLYVLAMRPTMSPLRVLSFAVLMDYLISLPFFLFFPVM